MDEHAFRTHAFAELCEIRRLLDALLQVDSGQFIAVPMPWRLGMSGEQYRTWKSDGGEMAAVQIDNPNASTVEVRFDGAQPTTANADARVAAHSGRIIVRRFTAISIGFDPSVNLNGAPTPVYITVYTRPLTPSTYPFAP